MASSVSDTLTNAARKVGNRAKTVIGDDWGAIKRGAKEEIETDRAMYRYYTGRNDSPKRRKPDPRKYPRPTRSSGR